MNAQRRLLIRGMFDIAVPAVKILILGVISAVLWVICFGASLLFERKHKVMKGGSCEHVPNS